MNFQAYPPKSTLLVVSILSVLTFGFAFETAYQQDCKSLSETTRLALNHLLYAAQLKDDMAVIDWGHDLEKAELLSAFRATIVSKMVVEGGNRNYLPPHLTGNGLSYHFPNQWIFHWLSEKSSSIQLELTICYRTWPGPFLWGLFGFFVCFLSGMMGSLGRSGQRSFKTAVPDSEPSSSKSKPAQQVKPLPPATENLKKPFLFLDKSFLIQEISPTAAEFFKKDAADLIQCHLLDLTPDPKLMQSIENGKEVKLENPFPLHPDISVFLTTNPNGTILHFEKVNTESLKNH